MPKRYKKPMTSEEYDQLQDTDIDYSDIPETDKAFWANARIHQPAKKQVVSMRLDQDVIDSFKQGEGKRHTSRMAAVLEAYVKHHKEAG
ncbi:BrnA antitoxin family protein [Labrenzia sp. R4_1]|uniref:BrnA antitoxin family protein n=1 Tax=Labrenzia sp. R4_1 TaxID=2821106 RepID=UPI001ADA92B0|nr:BrnA antitoxin family protein [Labrenzia sp. R4_1]MBO9427784.1 BrnA antitoxin family protein [Labrenzia sp. R4_1]